MADEDPKDAIEPEAPAEAAPADVEKPKKKKKKRAEADAAAEVSDPRAKEISVAFDVGNFARVRELGSELVRSDDAALAAIGQDYLTRISVDPVQIAFLGLCAIALLTIAWIYILH